MNEKYPLLIDAFSHIMPEKYNKALDKAFPGQNIYLEPPLWDLEYRFRLMDRFEGLVQVLTVSLPSLDKIPDKNLALDLARCANDEMAELVNRYPERFVGAAASLPLGDIDASLEETDRAIRELRFRGIQINSSICDKPLDSPEFLPLFQKMSEYDLPILIHPHRDMTLVDYKGETESKYFVSGLFGWPYETTVAMTRIVFSGVFDRFPNLKIITHHCGGMVPYYKERIREWYDLFEMRGRLKHSLVKAPIDYFKMFYNDTALYGNSPGLTCAYEFCGAEHIIFGADFPLGDSQNGFRNYRQTINAIEEMKISEEEKRDIFENNARKLMRLPV